MTRFQFAIAVCSCLSAYLLLVFWKRPATGTGRFFFKLSLINAASWLLILPQSSRGHPPALVIAGFILWLVNSPLLIVLAVTLWMDFREKDEQKVFLATASAYVLANVVMIWIVPALVLVIESYRD